MGTFLAEALESEFTLGFAEGGNIVQETNRRTVNASFETRFLKSNLNSIIMEPYKRDQ